MCKDLERKEKLEKVLTDKDFLSEIFKIKDDEEFIKKFESKGIKITKEDCPGIREGISKIFEELEKLDDDTLKGLSGGIWGFGEKKKSNFQKVQDAIGDSAVEIASDPAFLKGAVSGLFGLVKSGLSHLSNAGKSNPAPLPQPAPQPVVEAPAKESGNSQFVMGAATTAVVATAAGLVYANRKKLKKAWHNYMG